MDIMTKINRALKKSKLSITEKNDSSEKIAEKIIIFLNDGKRTPLTFRMSVKKFDEKNIKIELIFWETTSRIYGKLVELKDVKTIIPDFNLENKTFKSEIEDIKNKITFSYTQNEAFNLQRKSNYSEIYPDE